MNIVKGLTRTLKSSTEKNLRTEIGPFHLAAQLENRYMVGADGRTPTERLRGRGVQRPVHELGGKVLFLPLAPARRGDFGARFDYGIYLGCRSFVGQPYSGTHSGVIRCRTVSGKIAKFLRLVRRLSLNSLMLHCASFDVDSCTVIQVYCN